MDSHIYFLIHNFIIVYVGSTKQHMKRIEYHRKVGKVFDNHICIPCYSYQAKALETVLINQINPKYNGLINGGRNNGKYSHMKLPIRLQTAKVILGISQR